MDRYTDIINVEIEKHVRDRKKQPHILNGAMGYSLMAGGKRLRPALLLATCEALGGDIKKVIDMAIALEMIHTYSLIHDDLPAMDNDDLRRGKPTNHVVYGDGLAILAGDRLLNLAFETMLNACVSSGDKKYLKAMEVIVKASGDMVDGQAVDIVSSSKNMSKKKLLFIHRNKTAALIMASMEAGAILAGARKSKITQIKKAGYYLGMAFQVRDDYIEINSTEAELGKSKSDADNDKFTYIALYGEERAIEQISKLRDRIVRILDKQGLKNNILQKIITEILSV